MKQIKSLKFFTLLFALSFVAFACGGEHSHSHEDGSHSHDNTEEATQTGGEADAEAGPEYTSAYICPMHCDGSGSANPGKCPECGMDYVKNEAHQSDGHEHDGHDHDGHDHSHDGHSH